MNAATGYCSDLEDQLLAPACLKGGAVKPFKKRKLKTLKQRMATTARRNARQLVKITDTLPQKVRQSGFHYNENENREVLEASRELGNISDDESEMADTLQPVIKSHQMAYRYVASQKPGQKPKVKDRGLALNYDTSQGPFVKATYLNNGRVTEGVIDTALKNSLPIQTAKKYRKKRKLPKTAKKNKTPKK